MEYVAVLLPSVGVGLIFWLLMRWIFRADAKERRAQADAEAQAQRWYEQITARDREAFAPSPGKKAQPRGNDSQETAR